MVYDPAIVAWHLEHGSSGGVAAAAAMIAERRDVFFRKHRARLRFRYAADARAALFARTAVAPRGRVLFIEDQVPLHRLGQGFGRSNDIVAALAASGRHVTVYPVHPARVDPAAIHADMPENVEVMHDRGLDALEGFLRARRGYYDTIWIARTHNLERVKPILERGGTDVLGGVRLVLDTEAIAALREAARREALGEAPADLDSALMAEFADAWFCQAVVAVSEAEAARLRALGFPDVAVLGHARAPTPTPRGFEERAGMLFVGALEVAGSPNHDALLWFVDAVLPLIEAELGYETRLTVAGHVGDVDLSALESHPRVTLRGSVADLGLLYDRSRVFVAPTRFAAGLPYKVHEAASMGLPVVASALLADQLGWRDGAELMAVPVGDAAGFARAVLAVYRDAALWAALREGALRRGGAGVLSRGVSGGGGGDRWRGGRGHGTLHAMNVALRRPMSLTEFLAWEERQALRYEFDGFRPVAMTGGTAAHSAIQRNLLFCLTGRLRGQPCQPYGSELKIEVAGSIRYPDAFVVCTPVAPKDTVVRDPKVVFEILSESTANTDLIEKNAEYRATPSIQRYVILEQDHAAAIVFSRKGGDWVADIIAGGEACSACQRVGVEVTLSELYEGVGLDGAKGDGRSEEAGR